MSAPVRLRIVAVATLAWAVTGAACGINSGADYQLLDRFFAASRLRDRTALARLSTVVFEPLQDGIVDRFTIVAIAENSPDTRDVTIQAWLRRPGPSGGADTSAARSLLVVTLRDARTAGLSTAATRWVVTGFRVP